MFDDWDQNRGSSGTATFYFGSFDVGKAKQLLKTAPRPDQPLELGGYHALFKMISGVNSTSQRIDLDVPLIVVRVNGGLLPIDGWGRIAQAMKQERSSLPAVILNKDEKKAIQLGGVNVALPRLREVLAKNGISQCEAAVIDVLEEVGVVVKDG